MVKELTLENFNDIINSDKIVFIDFWAPWCAPCRAFGPIFESVSTHYDDVLFVKCNTEEQMKIATQFGIRSIPTIMAFKNGEVLFNQAGALPEQAFNKLVNQIKEADSYLYFYT